MNADVLSPPPWLRWLAVAFVAGAIFFTSVIDAPTPDGPTPFGPFGIFLIDKWLHALAYGGLAGTLAVALSTGRDVVTVAVMALLLATGYGIGIEFVQAPLAERYFSLADMAANGVGAAIGVAIWSVMAEFASQFYTENRSVSS